MTDEPTPAPAADGWQASEPRNAHNDIDLAAWLTGVDVRAGDFLKTLSEAARRADCQNYELMRPLLLMMKAKYPEYTAIGLRTFPWGALAPEPEEEKHDG